MDLYNQTNKSAFLLMEAIEEEMTTSGDVLLYHGTLTGKDDVNIESFKKGIDVARGKGVGGQKAGFFVFGSQTQVRNHAISLVNPSFKKGEAVTGTPMVITLKFSKEDFNSENFDLDAEISYKRLINFFTVYWNKLLQKVPNKKIEFNTSEGQGYIDLGLSKFTSVEGRKLLGGEVLPRYQFIKLIGFINGEKYKWQGSTMMGASTTAEDGAIFDAVFHTLENYFPNETNKAEKILLNQILMKGGALKYVGAKKIIPFKIEVYEEKTKKWIDVR